jgi:hypothetical protein
MEITNEERREVAERLRRQAHWMNIRKDWYDEDGVDQGNKAYRNIADSVEEGSNFGSHYEETVRKLAGLIDRPTCRKRIPDEIEGLVFCSNCGAEIGEYGVPNYCHNCGAEVIE